MVQVTIKDLALRYARTVQFMTVSGRGDPSLSSTGLRMGALRSPRHMSHVSPAITFLLGGHSKSYYPSAGRDISIPIRIAVTTAVKIATEIPMQHATGKQMFGIQEAVYYETK